MLVELPSFHATGDNAIVLEKRKCENREKKNTENSYSLMVFFNYVNSKKNTGKTTFFFSLKSVILRTLRTRKTKITFSTK